MIAGRLDAVRGSRSRVPLAGEYERDGGADAAPSNARQRFWPKQAVAPATTPSDGPSLLPRRLGNGAHRTLFGFASPRSMA